MNTEDEVIDRFGRVLDGGDSKMLLLRRLVGRSFRWTNEVSVYLRNSKGRSILFKIGRLSSLLEVLCNKAENSTSSYITRAVSSQ